jgi:hypothetical protein
MEFCEVCGIRPIAHWNIKFEEVNYKPVIRISSTIKNICDQCFDEWKKLVNDAARRFDIAQKLLDGKINREEDYKGPNFDYDEDEYKKEGK